MLNKFSRSSLQTMLDTIELFKKMEQMIAARKISGHVHGVILNPFSFTEPLCFIEPRINMVDFVAQVDQNNRMLRYFVARVSFDNGRKDMDFSEQEIKDALENPSLCIG